MILRALVELAEREGLIEDLDFEPKEVRWVISIDATGKVLGVSPTEGLADAKGKVRPKVMQVPRGPVRTSGSAANFLVDKAEYVLGFDPDDHPKKRAKLARHRGLFGEFVESALAAAPGDPGLSAILSFLRDDEQVTRAVDSVRDRAAANDLFAFRLDADVGAESGLVHDRVAVRSAWKGLRIPAGDPETGPVECLVCGTRSIPVRVHPQVKRVPGGTTSGIALVSFNAPAFESFGLEGNDNAPVCQACSDAYGTALSRLFHPQYTAPGGKVLPRRSLRLSEDTAVVYWASAESEFVNDFGEIEFANAEEAGTLYEAVRSGKGASGDASRFYALIVTGAQGRATLRGYYQTTIADAANNIRRYFDDIDLVRRSPNSPPRPALSWLIRSLAAQGKFEHVAPDLAGRLFLAILGGTPFPAEVLAAAVARIRAEPDEPDRGRVKHSRERLALIRATLNRWFRDDDPRIAPLIAKEIPAVLDASCTNNAYCLGRLFAVLEKLQGEAIGNPNTSIADRFYGSASATPAAVFGTLLRKAQHHLAKVGGPSYARKIQEVMALLSPEGILWNPVLPLAIVQARIHSCQEGVDAIRLPVHTAEQVGDVVLLELAHLDVAGGRDQQPEMPAGALERLLGTPVQREDIPLDAEAERPVLGLSLPLHHLQVSLLDGGRRFLGLLLRGRLESIVPPQGDLLAVVEFHEPG